MDVSYVNSKNLAHVAEVSIKTTQFNIILCIPQISQDFDFFFNLEYFAKFLSFRRF